MDTDLTRRSLLKAHAAAIAAATAGISLPAHAQSVPGGVEALEIKWSKAP
ncbi:twin-arginine translocation signal domain-containing protein, partial [Rhizobium sp. AQ_MP]